MAITVQRSEIDPALFDVLEGGEVVDEIEVLFKVSKIPRSFESLDHVKKWLFETERRLSRGYAYFLLGKKNYSKRGLLEKLLRKRYSPPICEDVLEELARLGYLNDEDYFQRAVLREFEKGKGPKYISMKLRLEVEKVRDMITPTMQKESIRKLIPKISKGSSRKDFQKTAAALMRRGFDWEEIQKEISNG